VINRPEIVTAVVQMNATVVLTPAIYFMNPLIFKDDKHEASTTPFKDCASKVETFKISR